MGYCANCGNQLSGTEKFCQKCGSQQKMQENSPDVQLRSQTDENNRAKYCPYCGAQNSASSQFCSSCRVTLYNTARPTSPPLVPTLTQRSTPSDGTVKKKNKVLPIVASVIALFLVIGAILLATTRHGGQDNDSIGSEMSSSPDDAEDTDAASETPSVADITEMSGVGETEMPSNAAVSENSDATETSGDSITEPASIADIVEVPDDGDSEEQSSLLEGFSLYENDEFGFKIQYPFEWVSIDFAIMSEDDVQEQLVQVFGPEFSDTLQQQGINLDPSSFPVTWYDFEHYDGGPLTNIIFNTGDSGGMTQANFSLIGVQLAYQVVLDDTLSMIFDESEFNSDVRGVLLGSNYFIIYTANTELVLNGVKLSSCTAMTENKGILYSFTASVSENYLSDFVEKFEVFLSTLEFINT